MKPTRQAKYRQVEEFLRLLDSVDHRRDGQGSPAPPDPGGPAAHRRPRLRQRLPDLRRAAVPRRRARPARAADRRRRKRAVARPQHRARRPASASTPTSSWAASSAPSSTRLPRSCSRCTPATPPPTRRWPAPSSGRPRWCWPHPAATTTSRRSCAGRRPRRRTPLLTRHGILRERLADTLTDGIRASLMRIQGYRVDVDAVRREPAHPAQHDAARDAQPARRSRAAASSRSTTTWWRPGPCTRASPYCSMHVTDGSVGAVGRAGRRHALPASASRPRLSRRPRRRDVVFRFTDPEIVESSGLVVGDGLRHGQRQRRLRRGSSSSTPRTGDTTVGGHLAGPTTPTTWRHWRRPVTTRVWVGDIGDNTRVRESVSVRRVPLDGSRRRASYELTYPDGARDAEALVAHPQTGQLFVISKSSSAARSTRHRASSRPSQPNEMASLGDVTGIVTDAAFLPDGRHLSCAPTRRQSSTPGPRSSRSARSSCRGSNRARASPCLPTARCSSARRGSARRC